MEIQGIKVCEHIEKWNMSKIANPEMVKQGFSFPLQYASEGDPFCKKGTAYCQYCFWEGKGDAQ